MRATIAVLAFIALVALMVLGAFVPRPDETVVKECIRVRQGPPGAVAECWSLRHQGERRDR